MHEGVQDRPSNRPPFLLCWEAAARPDGNPGFAWYETVRLQWSGEESSGSLIGEEDWPFAPRRCASSARHVSVSIRYNVRCTKTGSTRRIDLN